LKIELDAPVVGELEKKYLNEAIDKGFVSSFGPFIPEFEKRISGFLGVKGAVAVGSGTAAMHMSLYALGIGKGDEVIVPSLTFAASINPILYVDATPVIVDVDIGTWNMDPERVQEAITDRTKAIIPVHLYGNPCDMDKIKMIARENGIYVIEDAAESLGAKVEGKQTGTLGDMGVLSFNGNKLITTGGGGMVVSDDIERMEYIRYLANQAKDQHRPGFHGEIGFNFRMTNIQAALGLAQFEQINKFLRKKKSFKEIYRDVLGDISYIGFQDNRGSEESAWLSCIKIDKEFDIEILMKDLKNKGIPTRRIFLPLGEMPYLSEYSLNCPCAHEIYERGLCLPSSMLNSEEDIKTVASTIKEVIADE